MNVHKIKRKSYDNGTQSFQGVNKEEQYMYNRNNNKYEREYIDYPYNRKKGKMSKHISKQHHHIIQAEIGKSMKTRVNSAIINDIATIERFDLSDYSVLSDRFGDDSFYEDGEEDFTTTVSNTDITESQQIENVDDQVNGVTREQNEKGNKKKEHIHFSDVEIMTNRTYDETPNKHIQDNYHMKLKEGNGSVGILVKDVEDLFSTLLLSEQIFSKKKNEMGHIYESNIRGNAYMTHKKKKDKHGANRERKILRRVFKNGSNDINNLSDENFRKKKYSAIDYNILCKSHKLSIIDVIEDPNVEQELVNIVKKVNLKVHWEDGINIEEKSNEQNNKQKKKKKGNSMDEDTEGNRKENQSKNKTVEATLKSSLNNKKGVKELIKYSKKENEFDAVIDLLKGYYKLKQTPIYYISEDRSSLLPGQISINEKNIDVQLVNDKHIQIKIENIKRVEDRVSNTSCPKIKNIKNFNAIKIIYEQVPKKILDFIIIFQDKLKLFLFISLLKSYYRINFKKIPPGVSELMAKYNKGVDVKKISKRGNISDIKIIIADSVIRLFSITKMKGQIFDVSEDFISFEPGIDTSHFNILNEYDNKGLNEESCLVLNFMYQSIPLIFPSPDDRDDFIMLLLFIRRQH